MHILCICVSLYFLMFCLPAPSPVSEAMPPVPHPQLTSHHSRGPVRLRARRSPQLAHRIGRQSASSIRARGRLTATRSLGWCWVICLVSCTPPPPPPPPQCSLLMTLLVVESDLLFLSDLLLPPDSRLPTAWLCELAVFPLPTQHS